MSPTSQLKSAISSNDNETVSKLLEKMDIEAVNRKEKGNTAHSFIHTALHLACYKKNQEALDSLLAIAGIDVNVKDETGWTPLYTSVIHDNLQAVTKLLDRPEVDVNAKSIYGSTPLHLACRKNLHSIVRKLLGSPGIDVNAKDVEGDTPIMECVLLCKDDALNVMLDDPRVNLDIKDKNGKGLEEKVGGAFGYSKDGSDTCLEMIKNERMRRVNGEVGQEQTSQAGSIVKIEKINKKIATALHLACYEKNHKALDSLLVMDGIDVNVKDKSSYGATPLHIACRKNLHLIVRKLLASPGIDVNAEDIGGDTPIMDCALMCKKDALNVMLDDPRVNLDIKDKNGKILEEKVGAFGYSKEEKDTCLDMIKKERMRRGNREVGKEQTSQAGSIVNMEKINKKIVMEEEKSYKNLDIRKRKMEDLIEKQTLDKKILAKKYKEESSLMEKNQRRELSALQETLGREYHDEQRYIASHKEHWDELSQEKEKPNNDASSQELSKLDPIKRSFECPVCMEQMRPPTKIWMCRFSHIICEVCKDNLKAEGGNCPTCTTEPFIGRNYVVEDLARTVFNEYPSKSNPLRSIPTTGTRNISSPILPVIQEGSSRDSVASTGSVSKKRRKLGLSQVSSV